MSAYFQTAQGDNTFNISRHLIRAPFSVDKIQYSCRESSVIYKTKMVKRPNRNFQVYDPLDFMAAVTAHIPDRREHLGRYYGWYSSVQRGKRRKRIVSIIGEEEVIRKILEHLKLWEEPQV